MGYQVNLRRWTANPSPVWANACDTPFSLFSLLFTGAAVYVPEHPQVARSEALIHVLKTQSRILGQSVSERNKATVEAQVKALKT
jgi:hypothetical protein